MVRDNWLLAGFARYAAFSGRSRRLEFWGFAFVLWGLGIWAVLLDALLAARGWAGGPACLTTLAALTAMPGIAVAVRRLHDMGRSGWWVLTAFVPVAGLILPVCLALVPPVSGGSRFGSDPRRSFDGAVGWVLGAGVLLYGVPLGMLLRI